MHDTDISYDDSLGWHHRFNLIVSKLEFVARLNPDPDTQGAYVEYLWLINGIMGDYIAQLRRCLDDQVESRDYGGNP
jgi:hypothetical protein